MIAKKGMKRLFESRIINSCYGNFFCKFIKEFLEKNKNFSFSQGNFYYEKHKLSTLKLGLPFL